mmetsp:Transcript_59436/g.145470  ORF Transcript_59436/g.145470 Transcript_59436/m.145470 type:complete len:254 (+) Transcript_59436:636-1397(+)
MNRTGGEATATEHVFNVVTVPFGFREDQNQAFFNCQKEAHQCFQLFVLFHVFYGLRHILRRGTDSTDRQEDVVSEEVTCQPLDIGREGSAKHHRLAVVTLTHSRLFNDPADLGLETHIQHPIGLVKDQVMDVVHAKSATFDQVDEPSWRRDQKVATALDLPELVTDFSTTVDTDTGDTCAVTEPFRFLVDLLGQFTGGGQDQCLGVDTTASTGRFESASVNHGHDDGEQEPRCLSRTSLGARHQVPSCTADGA